MNTQIEKAKKNNKGFTLVELIIVIAIIAILAVVLAPNLVKWVDNSRWSTDKSNAAQLLRDTKTAVVEVQTEDATWTPDATIEMNRTNTSVTNGDNGGKLDAQLTKDEPGWKSTKITHTTQHKDTDGSMHKYNKYTITVDSDGVKGDWAE